VKASRKIKTIQIAGGSVAGLQLHVNEALPVNISPLTGVAVIVTGVATAAVHVAVT
jgi:hypothetical protein